MNIQLKNWSYGTAGINVDVYTAPELIHPRLAGNVYNHPSEQHFDGKEIVTSTVIGKRNNLIVTRSGSEYELLEPSEAYEKEFPDAKNRLLKTLPEI